MAARGRRPDAWRAARTGTDLLADVLVGRRRHDREADEEDVRLRVAERPQSVVVLLARRVKQAERVRLAPDHHRHRVVVEHLRGGNARRRVVRKADCALNLMRAV